MLEELTKKDINLVTLITQNDFAKETNIYRLKDIVEVIYSHINCCKRPKCNEINCF